MDILRSSLRLAVVATSLICGCAASDAGGRTLLKLRVREGDHFTFEVTNRTSIAGPESSFFGVTTRQSVLIKSKSQGYYNTDVRLERLVSDTMSTLKAIPLIMVFKSRMEGSLSQVEYDELGQPSPASPRLDSTCTLDEMTAAVASAITLGLPGFFGAAYPYRAVSVGDTWRSPYDLGNALSPLGPGNPVRGSGLLPLTYTFAAIEQRGREKCARISFTGAGSTELADASLEGDGLCRNQVELQGTVRVELQSGVPTDVTLSVITRSAASDGQPCFTKTSSWVVRRAVEPDGPETQSATTEPEVGSGEPGTAPDVGSSTTVAEPAVAPLANPQTYTNDTFAFSIDFPAGWTIKGSLQRNTVVKAVRKTADNDIAMVTVGVVDLASEAQREGRKDITRADAEAIDLWQEDPREWALGLKEEEPWAEVRVLEARRTLLAGRHAIFFKVELSGPQGVALTTSSYMVMNKGRLYRVRGHAAGGPDWFAQNEAELLASMRTLRLLR